MPEQNGSKAVPEFDFSKLSWKDNKLASVMQMKVRQASEANDFELFEKSLGELETLYSRVVVTVPRDWLVADAPDDLDWGDTESFNWLGDGRFEDLGRAMADAREERSKNL